MEYDKKIRRVTIDINQAGNYIAVGDYPSAKKNIADVLTQLERLVNELSGPIDETRATISRK